MSAKENLKTYLCRNCRHEGTPIDKEPCYTCTYYNIEAMSPVEFIYIHLQEIFDNYDCYDRRLKAYEYLNIILQVENLTMHRVIKSEAAVCVHPFKFVVIHGSRCHCLRCGCDVDTQTDL